MGYNYWWSKMRSKCVFYSLLTHHRRVCSNMDFIIAETFLSFLAFSYSFVVDPPLLSPARTPLFWCFLALPSPWRNAPLLMISMWKRAARALQVWIVRKRSRKWPCAAFNIRACLVVAKIIDCRFNVFFLKISLNISLWLMNTLISFDLNIRYSHTKTIADFLLYCK